MARGIGKALTEEDVMFIIQNAGTLSITDISKKLGVSAIRVSKIMKLVNSQYVSPDGEEVCRSSKGKKLSSVVFDAAQKLGLQKK